MPPIPPPGMAGEPESFFGLSATIASVVTRRPATELASCDLLAGLGAFEHPHTRRLEASPSIFTSVPDHLPNNTRSPGLRSMDRACRPRHGRQGQRRRLRPPSGFSFAVSGIMMPPFVFSSPSRRRRTTRSIVESYLEFHGVPSSGCETRDGRPLALRRRRVLVPISGRTRARKQGRANYGSI